MSAVLIAANEHEARHWQRSHPDRWDTVVSVSHPAGVRGLDMESAHVTPQAARQMTMQFHEDVEFMLRRNGERCYLQFLRDCPPRTSR